MRKLITRIIIFFFTLLVGLGIYFIWYISISPTNQDAVLISEVISSESKPIKAGETKTEPWVLKIKPCSEKNNFQQPSSEWKGKGAVNRGVVNGAAVCGLLPEYSLAAKEQNISDVVTVDVLIDEVGEVQKAKANYGNPLLRKSAEEAAKQTRFTPMMLGGEVYKSKGVLMYKFDNEKGTWLQDPGAPDNPFKKVRK